MREPVKRVIDSRTYEVTHLPSTKAMTVLTKITKLFGPVINRAGSILAAIRAAQEGVGSTEGAALFAALGAIAEHLDEAEVNACLLAFAAHSRYETTPGSGNLVMMGDTYETHFQGEIATQLRWALFAAEVNFGPLTRGLGLTASAPSVASAAATR